MKIKWPEKNKNGFMRFRWPVVLNKVVSLVAAEKMNDYSLEQYTLSDRESSDFDDFIAGRLIGQSLDGLHKLQIYVSHLADRIEVRIPVVDEGFRVCGGLKCPNPDSEVFYNHSTYSRDGAILFLIQGIQDLIYTNHTNQNIDDQMAGQMSLRWSQLQTEICFDILGHSLNLGQIVNVWNQNQFSSDPNQSPQKRWGLAN
jgi:hypothetical protein